MFDMAAVEKSIRPATSFTILRFSIPLNDVMQGARSIQRA
jgi:hypothetical protein